MEQTAQRAQQSVERQPQGCESSLQTHISEQPPNIPSLAGENESYLTPEDFQRVVDYACMLQQLDLQEQELHTRGLEALTTLTPNSKGIPRSVVSQVIADHMQVGKPYAEKALDIHFPSREQQMKDIQENGATPTLDVMMSSYLYSIAGVLRKAFPDYEAISMRPFSSSAGIGLVRRHKEKGKFLIFFPIERKWEEHVSLANMRYDNGEMYFTIGDPRFLRVCGDELKKLSSRWKIAHKLEYNYHP